MSTVLQAEIDRIEESKKSPNVDPDSKKESYKQSLTSINNAVEEWRSVNNKNVEIIGWMKINFLNENSPKSDRTIEYPPQIAKKKWDGDTTRNTRHYSYV